MRIRAAAILAVVMVTGCKYGAAEFACSAEKSCGPGGTCESNGFCSFADSTCESGRRFGELGGASSGECVPAGGAMIDASIDAPPDVPPDARACFGTAPFTICFAAAPSMPVTLDSATPIDTTSSNLCVPTLSGATNYCVIAGTTISVDVKLRATGAKPLVLLASDTITINAPIDVGSHRGVTPEVGAGADPAAPACAVGTLPGAGGGNGAGGAGGSFIGLGGGGGTGGNAGTAGVAGAAIANITTLRGGCPGQDGQGGNDKGVLGHGGGAVLLIAGVKIDVAAAVSINAAGEGGAGGLGNVSGGGGAGAGGMIAFDAPMFTCTAGALLLATGGGGGEGSDSAAVAPGNNGSDPIAVTAAAGGSAGAGRGGDGGAGSVAPGTVGGPGGPGDNVGATRGGGGGGGGGAGLIKAFAIPTLCTLLAPPAAP